MITGNEMYKSCSYVTDDTSPIVQNTIACKCVSGFAIYFINPNTDDIAPPINIPDKTSERVLSNLILEDNRNTNNIFTIPKANARNCIETADIPITIPKAAPTHALVLTPNIS